MCIRDRESGRRIGVDGEKLKGKGLSVLRTVASGNFNSLPRRNAELPEIGTGFLQLSAAVGKGKTGKRKIPRQTGKEEMCIRDRVNGTFSIILLKLPFTKKW